MIFLKQDNFNRNVFYSILEDGSCLYTVYVDPDNTTLAFTVHRPDRNDDLALYTINSLVPG